jgi:hypothetical protein
MKNILVPIILALLFLFQAACKEKNDVPDLGQYSNQIILDWNLVAFETMGGAATEHGLLAVRVYAMAHLAMHDALNAVAQRYQTYTFHQKNVEADPIAAVASAAYGVLVASNPDQKSMLDGQLAESLAKVPEGKSKAEGIELGKAAAAAILAHRQNDGAFQDPIGVIPPSNGQPGTYQAVPPFDFVFAPHWRTMQTFSLENPEQFRMAIHPALSSDRYTTDFNEVKIIGQKDSPERNGEQSLIAKFWYEYSELGWNRITRVAVAERKLDILATARLFALVNMALSDAYTAGWDANFHYNFWRPYTAIRSAETDGNPNTLADLQWEPAEPTPPVQDYPSTHSALGNAAAYVLASVLGDSTEFTFSSPTAVPANVSRSFQSFSQAANENAESRVLAGIHFRFSCEKGQELGNKIGKWTMENHLKPVK